MSTSLPDSEIETHSPRDFWRRHRWWLRAVLLGSILVIGYWGAQVAYSIWGYPGREFARGSFEHRFRRMPAFIEQAVPADAQDVIFGWEWGEGTKTASVSVRYKHKDLLEEYYRLYQYVLDRGFEYSAADSGDHEPAFRAVGDLVVMRIRGHDEVCLTYWYDSSTR